jgi:GH25 family lysozyme M1 (1,4-beta-N-acetylmuramidase)
MAFGIDIYRYQTVTDWAAVRRAGVEFVYVKATDGAGYAPVRADKQVRGAQGVDLPVGCYHFSQPGDPVAQANLLLSEVRRLNAAGVGPALDLEDNPPGTGKANIPDSQKTGWALEFLRTVAAAGYRPTVYMSSSLAKTLRPDRWDIRALVIWIASYGVNDGRRHALTGGYPGRVDIHQYTSLGRVPGIAGAVDLSESLTPVVGQGSPPPEEDDTMFIECKDRGSQAILSGGILTFLDAESAGPVNPGEKFPRVQVAGPVYDVMVANSVALLSVPGKLDALAAKLDGLATAGDGVLVAHTFTATGGITLTPDVA